MNQYFHNYYFYHQLIHFILTIIQVVFISVKSDWFFKFKLLPDSGTSDNNQTIFQTLNMAKRIKIKFFKFAVSLKGASSPSISDKYKYSHMDDDNFW